MRQQADCEKERNRQANNTADKKAPGARIAESGIPGAFHRAFEQELTDDGRNDFDRENKNRGGHLLRGHNFSSIRATG